MANSNTIGVGEVDNTIATVIAAQALGYLKANTVMARLVARDWDNEVATHGQVISIPYGGSLSVNDKADDSTVTKQVVEVGAHVRVVFLDQVQDLAHHCPLGAAPGGAGRRRRRKIGLSGIAPDLAL